MYSRSIRVLVISIILLAVYYPMLYIEWFKEFNVLLIILSVVTLLLLDTVTYFILREVNNSKILLAFSSLRILGAIYAINFYRVDIICISCILLSIYEDKHILERR